jgi:bacillithiol biosynthesis cysteine-adding enzyme BshC
LLAGFPFGDEVTSLVEETYRPGETFGAAFPALLRRLLADYGLLYIDPLAPAVREIAVPFLREAALAAPDLGELILARNRDLTEAGYHAQVHFEKETSLFFLLDGARRVALRRKNGDYVAKDRRLSASDLAGRAEQLSPNALLRPVMQDYILPTVAYVGGPAELAYLAQAQVIYRTLLGRMPVAVSRGGFTLLDGRAGKLMQRYGLRLEHCFHGDEPLRERIAATLVPSQLNRTFEDTATTSAGALDRLEGELRDFDPTLAAALSKSRAKILYQLSKIEGKASREALRRDQRAASDAAYLSNLVYPNKHLQERFYGILPFLAKHGVGLVGQIYDHVRLECPDHNVLLLG